MKGQPFARRFGFAVAGMRALWRSEASFRAQARLADGAALAMILLRPGATWCALVALAAGMVLAAEALNGALEHLADALHPGSHPLIGMAKDMAAAGVLIASASTVGVAALLVMHIARGN